MTLGPRGAEAQPLRINVATITETRPDHMASSVPPAVQAATAFKAARVVLKTAQTPLPGLHWPDPVS